ncbi:adenylate/guanylate cyclase domain-containing protein [Winogradskyella flava]|uniref:Tetratricopeptide repeat protein n=1 Tax=Winogradskyella flava TaxID=1884876 RepID=A0A842IT71_9FLAO|nr:adenylate/guanylate cyclase domain-containing protein [Winogradskyella flava]MBC2845054.1 tetratricopeptide repeat protein [Winogradskyella flava]
MLIKIKTYIISIGLFLFSIIYVYCQDQKKADSIKELYKSGNYKVPEFIMLSRIAEYEINPDSALHYAEILIEKAIDLKPKDSALKAFWYGYLTKGNSLIFKGDNSKAITAFLKGLDYAKQAKNERSVGLLQISIADTYAVMENNEFAEQYYAKGIELLRKIPDSLNLASALLNVGDWSFNNHDYNKAISYFEESSLIFERKDYLVGKAYNLGNIGMVHAEQDKDELAEKNINEAITILDDLEDYYPISVYLTYLADIYANKGNFDMAFKYADRSLDLAKTYGLKEQIGDAHLELSKLHETAGNEILALGHYKNHILYRDSIRNIEEVQKISNAMNSKTQAELDLETQKSKTQRIILWSTVGVLLLIGVLAYNLFKKNIFVKKTNKIIAAEKDRSDKLLLNILPEETAQELKDKGRVEAKKFPSVTVLFSDFKGFTSYAENLSPEKLVETIDHYFSKFDLIMEKYGLEKIKTIGDAYMAVGGLSFDNVDQAKEMVLAAQEMNDFVNQAKIDDVTTAEFDIRIGINTGPVVAGVVGTKKFAYDIWGDTVNIAARMESSSEPGRINISEDTYQVVKDNFNCEFRGKLAVKNRGELNMYFVES